MPDYSLSDIAAVAANCKPYEDVMKVVDEHLETIRMLYPKTYDGLVQRIREL